MTKRVRVRNGPDRLACERCGCELGAGPNPRRRVLGADADVRLQLEDGERDVKVDLDCECNCHDTWRTFFDPRFHVDAQRVVP